MPKKRKITLPPEKKSPNINPRDVVVLPELQSVLDDAASIINMELSKIKSRVYTASNALDPDTARLVQGYVKAVVDLSREHRERDKQYETDDLSDSDLLNMFLENMSKEEVAKLLQDTINKKSDQGKKDEE